MQFVKFANIEEDTPSYHRRYDFFVSHFSALCHSKESTSNDYIKWDYIKSDCLIILNPIADFHFFSFQFFVI